MKAGLLKSAAAYLLIIALPAAFCLDTSLAILRGWKLEAGPVRFIALVVALLCVGMAGMFVLRRIRKRKPAALADAILLLVSTAIVFGIIEVVATRIAANDDEFHHRRANLKREFGIEEKTRYITNSLGIRGPEVPEDPSTVKVLCIGGSTTELTYIDQEQTWYHLAMNDLNESNEPFPFWFGAIGVSGYATANHLQYVQESDFYGTLDYALFLVGINDMLFAIRGMPNRYPGSVPSPPFWARTATADLLVFRVLPRMGVIHLDMEDAGRKNYLARRERRRNADKTENANPIERPLQKYKERIRAIIEASRARDVEPVFMTQPTLWSATEPDPNESRYWMGELPTGDYLRANKLRERMDAYNKSLRVICSDLDVEYIELTTLDENENYFVDDCHFSDEGSKQVAEKVASAFRSLQNSK